MIDRVLRVPAVSLMLSVGLLIALAIPALGMHTVSPGTVGLPSNLPIMRTYDRIQRAFPGGPMPAVVVVQAPNVAAADVQAGIAKMTSRALASGQMGGPVVGTISARKTVEMVTISLAGNGTDERSGKRSARCEIASCQARSAISREYTPMLAARPPPHRTSARR